MHFLDKNLQYADSNITNIKNPLDWQAITSSVDGSWYRRQAFTWSKKVKLRSAMLSLVYALMVLRSDGNGGLGGLYDYSKSKRCI